MTDLNVVMQEHRSNIGFREGPSNSNPWGPEQGVKNAAYCDSASSMVPYHHGLRWWDHCQFKEKGCAYTVYHVNAGTREGKYIPDHASQGKPTPLAIGDLVFFDWNGNGGVDHVETVAELPQGPTGNQYITIGYNTGSPGGCYRRIRDRKYLHGAIKMEWAYAISEPVPQPPQPPQPPPPPPHQHSLPLTQFKYVGGRYRAQVWHPERNTWFTQGNEPWWEVRDIQQHMRNQGHNIVVDGLGGPDTYNQVRAYQAFRGLQADGVVGPKTWAHLHS